MSLRFKLCDYCVKTTIWCFEGGCCKGRNCDHACDTCLEISEQLVKAMAICGYYTLCFPPRCAVSYIANNCCEHNLTKNPHSWYHCDLKFYCCFKRNHVTSLYLSFEKLTFIPKNTFNLTNLTSLSCAHNNITVIPSEIKLLKHLEELSLSNNQISNVPIELFELEKLRQLDLSHNGITEIPKQIGNLTRLIALRIQHNQLTVLPNEIGKLESLVTLDVSNNQMATIPYSIMNLKNLNTLEFRVNNINVFPKYVFFKNIYVYYSHQNFQNNAEIVQMQNNNQNNFFAPLYDERLELDFGLSLA